MEQKKTKKRTAPPRYDDAFKAGTVRLVTEQGRQPVEVAKELGICIDTLHSWLKASGVQMGQVSRQNREQKRIRELEAENRSLRRQLGEKDGHRRLKKIRRHPVETVEEKYRCVQTLKRQGACLKCELVHLKHYPTRAAAQDDALHGYVPHHMAQRRCKVPRRKRKSQLPVLFCQWWVLF